LKDDEMADAHIYIYTRMRASQDRWKKKKKKNIPVVLPFGEREEINKRTSSFLSHTDDNGNVYLLYPPGASRWNANIIKQSGIEESERRKFVDNRREHTYIHTCHTGVDGLKH